jgi:hypothetical protein
MTVILIHFSVLSIWWILYFSRNPPLLASFAMLLNLQFHADFTKYRRFFLETINIPVYTSSFNFVILCQFFISLYLPVSNHVYERQSQKYIIHSIHSIPVFYVIFWIEKNFMPEWNNFYKPATFK